MDFCWLEFRWCNIFWNMDRNETQKEKYLENLEKLV